MIYNISFKNSFLAILALLLYGTFTGCSDRKFASEPVVDVDPKIKKLRVQKGFRAEHLYSPADNNQGSWVAMTFDGKGRLITSDQFGALYRVKIPAVGLESVKPEIEKLVLGKDSTEIGMGYAQGLLWAFNSLYVVINNRNDNEEFGKQSGLYRIQDTDGDDTFDKITLLKALEGSGEHGPHSIVLGPDKKSLYIIAGNHTNLPEMDAYRLPPVWQRDNIFPEIKDPRGHANDRKAPGGWIAKVDSLGENWELISAGYRNPFDLAFNERGDMFTYDSDMEWDFGLPWYRPTRICHVTSGSEYGWRTGNGKWSPEYPDNLPPVLNIGQGSPTNLIYGERGDFPDKYRKALFAFDWSFGIIYAIFLEPQGASYRAIAEEFLSGSPLPLTDGVFGPDGALYFLTGGRRLQSDLYRISYTDTGGGNVQFASENPSVENYADHEIREKLEHYHSKNADANAIDFAWPYLAHQDRFIRYAARLVLEHQPVELWQERTLGEKNSRIFIESFIALARHADQGLKDRMIKTVFSIDYEKLSAREQLDLLRGIELVLYRKGKPKTAMKEQLVDYLNPYYPAQEDHLNRLLSKILVHLDAPEAVAKTIALLKSAKDDEADEQLAMASSDLIMRNPQYGLNIARMLAKTPPAQQTFYATALSEANAGWTPELYEEYFNWIYNAFRYEGGKSYVGFIDKARQKALAHVPQDKVEYYNTISGDSLLSENGINLTSADKPKGPGRRWKVGEALTVVEEGLVNRDLERGKQLFAATLCSACHSMNGEGGAVGPDLTQLGNRFSMRDILEATIHPNKAISDQYGAKVFHLKDGSSIVGRLMNEDDTHYYVSQNPFAPQQSRKIAKSDVTKVKISEVSVMLPGLINPLNPEELKDLMAYLVSAGNENHEVYASVNDSEQDVQ
ncbi:MAG: c-type cytochrome [Fulvivirga sp.]